MLPLDSTIDCSYSDIQVPPNSILLLHFEEMLYFCFIFFFLRSKGILTFGLKHLVPKSLKMLSLTFFYCDKIHITLNLPFK